MNVLEATRSYENWMRGCAPIIKHELRDKHSKMRKDPYQFLRGTYYRWAELWRQFSQDSVQTPTVLAVGDLHIGSYGTWRDAEGRMCWGVDDFDEAWPLPYTNDLTRLAASVKIARKLGILKIRTKAACEVILRAYEGALQKGGCPIVLAEEETHLEKLGIRALKPPKSFWQKLKAKPPLRGSLPGDARKALEQTLPVPGLKYRVVRREAGLGSLGQLRFVAIAEYRGGCIAREAKKLLPSANLWLSGRISHRQLYYLKAIRSAIRSPDPYQTTVGTWLIRRLSPDSNPIEVENLDKERDEEILLGAMATEAANVHLGNRRSTRPILRNLRRRKTDWLHKDAKTMARIILSEWKEYRTL
jgi:Uncharacterized protein conserved in bacteria (DUF2252)